MKKLLFMLLVLFLGLSVVNAESGIKPVFKEDSSFATKMVGIIGVDMKGEYSAFVGDGPDKKWGLYVYEGDTLKFYKPTGDGYYFNGVVILDNYIVVNGTEGKYYDDFGDSVIAYYVYDFEGNLVDKVVSKSTCDPGSVDPCTSSGFYGKIINAGDDMFAAWLAPDMYYMANKLEGQPQRNMYSLFTIENGKIVEVADSTKTNFDQFIMDNNADVPYVEAIYINGNIKAIAGDNRLIGTNEKKHLILYEGNTKVFDTDEGIEYDDNLIVKDITVLDSHVVILVKRNDVPSVMVYSLDGKLISTTSLDRDWTYIIAGSGNEYAYNGDDAGELLKVAVHYTLDLDVAVDGLFDLYLTDYPSLEGDRLAYLYPGDSVTVKIVPEEGREIVATTIDGEEMNCTEKDGTTTCTFTMPSKDAKVVVHTQPIPYKILDGDKPVYDKKNKKIVIRSEGPIAKFKSVTVNGKELTKDKDYTIKEGSTIVTLSESYLKTLKNGSYELAINFTDGRSSTTTLQVGKNPNTADAILTLIVVAGVSLMLVVITNKVKVKRFN